MTGLYRYVVHDRVHAYEAVGWMLTPTHLGHHAYWSVLMFWPCACKCVEPIA